MRTVNISLPNSLVQKVEALLNRGEYASRSEVFRTALRLFLVMEKEGTSPELLQFTKRPLGEMKKDLLKAGHKKEFVQSVVEGLKKSSVYRKQ